VASVIYEQNAIVHTAGRTGLSGLGDAWRDASACHQGETTHALGIIGAYDRTRRNVVWATSELPDDVACLIYFDDAIVIDP
jgi:hypothetical protein